MSAAPLPGYVYLDKNFRFEDGTTKAKLFVVLCDSTLDDDCVLVARTTSKPKSRVVEACFNDQFPPNYCFPLDSAEFEKDTWIMFDYVREYLKSDFNRWNRLMDLTIAQTSSVLGCISGSMYVEKWIAEACANEAASLSPNYSPA